MSEQKTILIAEDDADLKNLLTTFLKREGHRVLGASNPIEAASLLGTELFGIDLLVADVAMPGMSGPELARELRCVSPNLKVLFMTGAIPDSPCTEHVSIVNHDVVLRKPFSLPEFKAAIDKALSGEPHSNSGVSNGAAG